MTYIDVLLGQLIEWVNKGINFITQHSNLFVWGFVAIMVSKLMKFKFNIGLKRG